MNKKTKTEALEILNKLCDAHVGALEEEYRKIRPDCHHDPEGWCRCGDIKDKIITVRDKYIRLRSLIEEKR